MPYWAACADAGRDQVIDDVWLVRGQPAGLQRALAAASPLGVGVPGPLPAAEPRERERGDPTVGTVRGQHAVVHTHRAHGLDVDTSAATPEQCAAAILVVFDARRIRS